MKFFEVLTGILEDGWDVNATKAVVQAENAKDAKRKVCKSLTSYYKEENKERERGDKLKLDKSYVVVSEITPNNGIVYSDIAGTINSKKPFIFVKPCDND